MSIKNIIKKLFGLVDREDLELLQQKVLSLEDQNSTIIANEKKIVEQKSEIDNLTTQVEKSNKQMRGMSEKASDSEKTITEQNLKIANLTSQIEKMKEQFAQYEKIEAFRQQIAKGEEKHGKGRPAKGRVDYHLKMDADLKSTEKILKSIVKFNPQDIINNLYRSWMMSKIDEFCTDEDTSQ